MTLGDPCPECGRYVRDFTFRGRRYKRIQHAHDCPATLDVILNGDTFHEPSGPLNPATLPSLPA